MKKLVSLLLTVCMCFSAGVMLTACAEEPCSHASSYMELQSTTATCTKAGIETYLCEFCKEYEETKEVEAYGHDFLFHGGDDPTPDSNGNTDIRCAECNEKQSTVTFVDGSSMLVENYSQDSSGTKTLIGRYRIEKNTYTDQYGGKIIIEVIVDPVVGEDAENFYLAYSVSLKQEDGVELSKDYYLNQQYDKLISSATASYTYEDGTRHFKFDIYEYIWDAFEVPERDYSQPVTVTVDFMSSVTVDLKNYAKVVAYEN